MDILLLPTLPIITGSIAIILHRKKRLAQVLFFLCCLAVITILLMQLNQEKTFQIGGWGDTGITVGFDALNLPFMLSSIIVAVAVSLSAMTRATYDGFFYGLIMILLGSLNAVYISRDLFNIYVTFELASIVGYILIAYGKKGKQIWAAMKYALLSSVGFSVFLIGAGLAYARTGSFSFLSLNEIGSLAGALVFTGLSVKSGLFFVSMWLPDVYDSTPAEIPLLSGIIIKAEDYLILRFITYDSFQWLAPMYLGVGAISAVIGAVYAFNARKSQRVLAYHTFSQIGFIVTASNIHGAWHAFSHSIFKGLLLLSAGKISERLKTQDLSKWKGKMTVGEYIPLLIGSLAIIGFPLTSGYVTKGGIIDSVPLTGVVMLTIASVATVISFCKFVFIPLSKRKLKLPKLLIMSYVLLSSGILFHGVIKFDYYKLGESLAVIGAGVVLYFLIRKYFRPISTKPEKLDESLVLFVGFIAVVLTMLIL